MKKIFFSSLLSLSIVFGLFLSSAAATSEQDKSVGEDTFSKENLLSQREIAERFAEIDQKYEVGEILEKEDEQFIKEYGNVESSKSSNKIQSLGVIQPLAGYTFYGTGSNNNGTIKAATLGEYDLNKGTINHSYRINMSTKISQGSAEKIMNSYTHSAYGLAGSGGLLKVYGKSDSRTCTGNSCSSEFYDAYSGIVAYYTTVVHATIYYSGGQNFVIRINTL